MSTDAKAPLAGAVGLAIPRATVDESRADWRLSVEWLKLIAGEVEKATTERPSLEITEDVVWALIDGGWATIESPNAPASETGALTDRPHEAQ